ncbi:hypothetical protein PIB30_067973 [Stylosanthes scabra]|uniref:Transposase (putative) gypsy type domain-containing protein n=1 Tax=Stylosanthes scabra TaxID=79078 RepID=A0ABU6VR21_9FABA|nr:hypothetical protein [Stylosanthes scabra]
MDQEDVIDQVSCFVDEECIEQLGYSGWAKSGNGVWVEFLLCSSDDRIFHRCKDCEFFYMYCCVFVELKVKFPFTDFQCGVLTQLRCAPSQLHPNSWAFARGFEMWMEYLEVRLSLEVFFALFQAKGVEKGQWISLSSISGRLVFAPYRSLFKGFKQMFVKVRALVGISRFMLMKICLKNSCYVGIPNLGGRWPREPPRSTLLA